MSQAFFSRLRGLWPVWSRPLQAILILLLLVYLPMLFLRQLLGMAIALDEKKVREDLQTRIHREMQSFISDAAPDNQVQKAFDEVVSQFPVATDTGIDEAWMNRFLPALKEKLPFEPSDLWIYGPDLRNLYMEGTPLHMREKARWIFGTLNRNIHQYARATPAFIASLTLNQGLPPYQVQKFTESILDGNQLFDQGKKFAQELWSERENLHDIGSDQVVCNFQRPQAQTCFNILTSHGRTLLVCLVFQDPRDLAPKGGILLCIPEKRIPITWYMNRSQTQARDPRLHRQWAPFSAQRSERVWVKKYRGLAWVDVARHRPEFHLIVSIPERMYRLWVLKALPWLDASLLLFLLLSIYFVWNWQREGGQIPFRIYGQINLALTISALLPLIGFGLVAWAYSSFHFSFEREELNRKMEERLKAVDDRFRSFLEQRLRKFRALRDWTARNLANPPLIAAALSRKVDAKEMQGFYVITREGKLIKQKYQEDRMMQSILKGVAFKLFQCLKLETTGSQSAAELAEGAMGDDLFKALMSQSLASFMLSLDRFFQMATGEGDPMSFFIDLMYADAEKKVPAGVIVLMESTFNLFPQFVKRDVLHETDTMRTLGLNTVKVIRFRQEQITVEPKGTTLSPREMDVYRLARSSQGLIVRDHLDSDDPWILGARKVTSNSFVVVGGLDGRPLLRQQQFIVWGLTFLVSYALMVLFGVTRFLSSRFAQPLLELRSAADAVSGRDFSVRVGLHSRDEFGELGEAFNRMTKGLHEREQMTRFVSGDVLEAVKADTATQHAEKATVTILFSDIRGFTRLSEQFDPAEIVTMLNDYFTAMEACIVGQGGGIDKYVGDAIMAVFRDRPGVPPHPWRAVRAALDMREALMRFNRERQSAGLFTISAGVGINTGEVISGRVGSRTGRLDYTVIGDAVNLAARLESESKRAVQTQIVASPSTCRLLGDTITTVFVDEVLVKGKEKPVSLYEVLSLSPWTDYPQ